MPQVLDFNRSYTFSSIFSLKAEVDELVADFGYSFLRTRLNLPQYRGELDRLEELRLAMPVRGAQSRLEEILPFVNLANENTRREVLIARVVTDLVHYTHAQLRIEYPIKVTEQRQGYLDYYLRSKNYLVVIEAKQEDLTNGFTQLATELIALDRWQNSTQQTTLIGAVTTGTVWQFGQLHRSTQQITQDLNLYRSPDDLEPLLRILVQALQD